MQNNIYYPFYLYDLIPITPPFRLRAKKMRSSEVFDSKGAPLASLSDYHRNLPISSTNLKLLT